MTKLVIVHGGQTGVDRGAHDGAIAAELPIEGYMPKNFGDELGRIPADVAKHLKRCQNEGLQSRTQVNLMMAHALLVVVADKQKPYATPGTRLTLVEARDLRLPSLVVDPTDSDEFVRLWVEAKSAPPRYNIFRLMVAGPRASRWADGQVEAARYIRALKGL